MKKTIKYILCLLMLVCFTSVLPIAIAENNRSAEWIDIVWGDNAYTEMELPDGFSGKSYPVPKCVAIDNNGNTISNMQVFVYAPDGSIVVVENDRFSTLNTGVYKICYSAEYKNLSCEKIIKVNVTNTCNELYFNVSDKIKTEVTTGEDVILYSGEYGGGLGDLSADCEVKFNGENCEIQNFGGLSFFTAKRGGVYSVHFTVTDFVGNQKTEILEINAIDSLIPFMNDVPVALKNRVGDVVKLPVAQAKLYAEGEGYLVPVKVYYDDTEITDTMSYTADTVGTHVVKYVAENVFDNNYKVEKTYQVEVVDPFDFDKYNGTYHYINNYITTKDLNQFFTNGIMRLSVDEGKDNGSVAFSNKINVNYIRFDFSAVATKGNFDSVRFTIVDSRNIEETLELCFTKDYEDKKTAVLINGEEVSKLDYFYGDATSKLSSINVKIDAKSNSLLDTDDSVLGTIKTYLNGKSYLGFTSGSVYITMCIEGATGENEVVLSSLAGVNLTDADMDIAAPFRIDDNRFNSFVVAELNEEVVIPLIKIYDFYDENSIVTLNVSKPGGISLYSGTMTEDYKFTVTDYGIYSFNYVISDSNGNFVPIYGTINVVDRVAPTITVEGVKEEYTVGEKIMLPKPVVSDNLENELSVFVFVLGDNFMATMINLKDYSYTFNIAGDYVIRYVVCDKAMNTVYLEFSVTCR